MKPRTTCGRLSNSILEIRNYNKGAELLVKALEVGYSPKDPEYFLSWGKLYLWMEDFEKAESLFLQAKNLAPDWIIPYSQLGRLYHRWE